MSPTKLAIIFHSRSGNVHQLARRAAETAVRDGADVRLLRVSDDPAPKILDDEAHEALGRATTDVREVDHADLLWADAIMIGTPVHFGMPAPQIMNFIDHSGPVSIPGKLMNKAATVFASGSMPHAGQQATILALHNALCHWGSIIVPNGSSAAILFHENNGSPYGTSSISRHEPNNVHEDNLGAIDHQTRRVLEVGAALSTVRAAPSSELVDDDRLAALGLYS